MTYYIIAAIASFVLTSIISMVVSCKNNGSYIPVSDRYTAKFSDTKSAPVEEIDPADMEPVDW